MTVYNRFHRWSAKAIWRRLFEALVQSTDWDIHMIDSTTAKAHRLWLAEKGGRCQSNRSLARRQIDKDPGCCRWLWLSRRIANNTGATRRRPRCHSTARAFAPETPPPTHLGAADTAYESDALQDFLATRGTQPVISNNPTQKQIRPFDLIAYRR